MLHLVVYTECLFYSILSLSSVDPIYFVDITSNQLFPHMNTVFTVFSFLSFSLAILRMQKGSTSGSSIMSGICQWEITMFVFVFFLFVFINCEVGLWHVLLQVKLSLI